ncbi:hypothetical protein [Lacticaseibacillus paracasei]|uniref:hypothetical protein n=1 Tax=Lacticaseibacillus paracasei TaxID=1597 RepID=UPI002477EEA8|nr:hypothetical protein [Lacticaseibacillus paracasei]MDH7443970.1 hypothetical protein [Lacticaseibacillus paracasei subsp. paracasei]
MITFTKKAITTGNQDVPNPRVSRAQYYRYRSPKPSNAGPKMRLETTDSADLCWNLSSDTVL